MLLTTDAVGGVWRYTIDLARGLSGHGIVPTVAVLGPPASAAQRAEADGLALVETGLPLDWTAADPAALAAATGTLQRLARAHDSVHLHAPALVGPAGWDRPVVAVAHSCVATWWRAVRCGALPADFAWRTAAAQAGLRAASAVIAPTAAHADALRACYGAMPIAVVPNGAAAGVVSRGRGVLTAGRLWDEGKNAAALDRAAPGLAVPVRAAGPLFGPNGATIELPHLDHLGTLDAAGMARAFASASVFVSLARYEPFGLAVLEAARAGLRLVLSDIASFRELWDGAARFVPLDGDPVPALRAALETPDDAALRRAARYTIDRCVSGTMAVHGLEHVTP